jgi:hypothetical protein
MLARFLCLCGWGWVPNVQKPAFSPDYVGYNVILVLGSVPVTKPSLPLFNPLFNPQYDVLAFLLP